MVIKLMIQFLFCKKFFMSVVIIIFPDKNDGNPKRLIYITFWAVAIKTACTRELNVVQSIRSTALLIV